jgi:Signal transduction histidine kinase
VSLLLGIAYWLDHEIATSITIAVFVLVIVYGYFFGQSTGKIIEANFSEKQAKEALQELADHLEIKVKTQTRNLEEKNKNLEKLIKMRSEFLDLASHQLRTPVGVIKNIMEMMDSGDMGRLPPGVRKDYIHNAFEKSLKLKKIISDILVTSELDTVSFTVNNKNAQDLHLEDLVDKTVAETKFEAGQKKIILDWQRPKKPLPLVAGYEHYLSYAISNLIDNAVKYTPSTGETSETRDRRDEPGRIKIRAEVKGREVVFSVEDNGIGIPPDETGNMFKKFNRASNARKMYTDGSGLGLYIIKEIVEGHGGRVGVESKLGEGSTFKIFLPIKK